MEPRVHLVIESVDIVPLPVEAGADEPLRCTLTLGRTCPDGSVEIVEVVVVPEAVAVAIGKARQTVRG